MQKVQRKPGGVRLSSLEKSYRENATLPKAKAGHFVKFFYHFYFEIFLKPFENFDLDKIRIVRPKSASLLSSNQTSRRASRFHSQSVKLPPEEKPKAEKSAKKPAIYGDEGNDVTPKSLFSGSLHEKASQMKLGDENSSTDFRFYFKMLTPPLSDWTRWLKRL